MKYILLCLLTLFIYSCVPIAIAPNLEEGKVIRAKKFKRKLPNRYSYIFTDSKAADEFYYFINTKFQRDHQYVEHNVPVEIGGEHYYISFYETDKETQTVNFLTMIIDRALTGKDGSPILEDAYTSRWGTWYIGLLISDEDFNDALNPAYKSHQKIVRYVEELKDEYYRMSNYNQAILPIARN